MEIQGQIKMIGATQKVSDKFSKREIVLTTNDKFPQDILIQLTQDNCNLIDKYKEGEQVSVSINLRGKAWTNPKDGQVKYFNTIEGWKIDYAGKHANDLQGTADMINRKIAEDDSSDSLPF